jgi:hypothetical protein
MQIAFLDTYLEKPSCAGGIRMLHGVLDLLATQGSRHSRAVGGPREVARGITGQTSIAQYTLRTTKKIIFHKSQLKVT